jgi:hypothetical protein
MNVDTQLRALQSLAAHLKLLLDCPEQFWRLLERKQYLDAVWLFLVARVVHQSLVDESEEDGWAQQGIDVLEQFPLVQRQWDAIAGFRNQISYRITQSLREELPEQVNYLLNNHHHHIHHRTGDNRFHDQPIPFGVDAPQRNFKYTTITKDEIISSIFIGL